ncbi:MAG: transglutaminase family protein [Saprospiraceae bacterium]|nr:transglutaminase family protein [Saprospiraceae bacterium]
MPIYKIKHNTHYFYEQYVHDSMNQMMLYPINDKNQKVLAHTIHIHTQPEIECFKDKYGNILGIFSIIKPHIELHITSVVEVEIHPVVLPVFNVISSDLWALYDKQKDNYQLKDYLQIEDISLIEEIKSMVNGLKNETISPFDNAKLFASYVYTNFIYQKGVTSIETKIDDIWSLKAGVCQDFAHFLLVMLRLVNIPARYVSGYVCPNSDEFRGIGATHAWVDVYIPDYGWIGIDPTNDCIASDQHIRLAVGRSFKDCSPFKGIFKGKLDHRLEVSVTVELASESVSSQPKMYQNELYETKPTTVTEVKSSEHINNSYQAFKQQQQQQQQ